MTIIEPTYPQPLKLPEILAGSQLGGKTALGTISSLGGVEKFNTINGALIASATILGSSIANATISGSNIINGTITGSKIANSTITGSLIDDSTITGSKISNGTITGAKIAGGTITNTNISGGTITGSRIASSTITADKISISSLSALSATLGTITSGNLTSFGYIETVQQVNVGASFLTTWKFGVSGDSIFTGYIQLDGQTSGYDPNGDGRLWYVTGTGFRTSISNNRFQIDQTDISG